MHVLNQSEIGECSVFWSDSEDHKPFSFFGPKNI